MRETQPLCVGCKARAPETATNYTLIGSQHGWRVTRTRRPDGSVLVEWRCANCWKTYKEKTKDHPPSSSATPIAEDAGAPRKRKTSRPPPRRP